MNKRQEILRRIKTVKVGTLFDGNSFVSENIKRGDVAVIFCKLKKEGTIKSLSKGIFYKPEMSSMGFGELPLDKEELLKYFTRKLDAHISGQYGYNLLGLTEQNAQTITLAGKQAFKEFSVQNISFKYMKSEIGYLKNGEELSMAILLDALKNIDNITGKTGSETFQKIRDIIERRQAAWQERLVEMAKRFPTRARYLLSRAIEKSNGKAGALLMKNVCNKSQYDTEYKHTVLA